MITTETVLIFCALLLFTSILGSKASSLIGVPALLLFLGLGMFLGSDGVGGIYFDNPWLAQFVGVIALVAMLFSGGLDTRLRDVRPVLREGLALATVGVAVSAVAVGLFAVLVLDWTLVQGLLLGSIIASTDAAAIFTVLRGRNLRLKRHLKPLLELESGSNDPMAVFLTIAFTTLLTDPTREPLSLIPMFIQQMVIGGLFGLAIGRAAGWLLNRSQLEFDGLYPVLTIAIALLAYSAPAVIGGNGFLSVYLTGLVLGSQDFIHKASLRRFHDGLAWLLQIGMFLTLGLQVFPSQLPAIAPQGIALTAFMLVVARPLTVFIALAFSRRSVQEKLFISWVGLRGAAPIVLATFPLLAGVGASYTIFNLVFFVVLTSVLLQGTLIRPAARLLGVAGDGEPPSPLRSMLADGVLTDNLVERTVAPESSMVGRQIVDLHLPESILFLLIGRDHEVLIPRGSTVIEAGDLLLVAATEKHRDLIERLISGERTAERVADEESKTAPV